MLWLVFHGSEQTSKQRVVEGKFCELRKKVYCRVRVSGKRVLYGYLVGIRSMDTAKELGR